MTDRSGSDSCSKDTLQTMLNTLQAINDQIQRLKKVEAEIMSVFPELKTFQLLTATRDRVSSSGSTGEIKSVVASLRKAEGGTWRNTIAALLRENGKLRRREILEKLPISKHTLNTLLSKNKNLFQHDDLGFWSLKTNEQMQESPENSTPPNET